MRLVKISAPEGMGGEVAQKAFSVGIEKVSRRQDETHNSNGKVETKDFVNVETSTPQVWRQSTMSGGAS